MEDRYIQSLLENDKGKHVAWIPAKLAVPGNVVSFNDEEGKFLVKETYPGSLPWSVVNERGQDYKKTRKASDV